MIGAGRPAAIKWALWAALFGCAWISGAAHAETLADAIALAYQSNPDLQSDRAQLRALDETYVQARAGFGPTAQFGAAANYQRTPTLDIFGVLQDTPSNDAQLSLSASQILYNGGRTAAQVDAAEANILAGREQLRATEASILLNVIEAYAAVNRDQEIFDIRDAALGVFQRFAMEAKARFNAGDATQTDVGQAQSQLASAQSDLSAARAQLQISRAAYAAVVGQNPGALAAEPVLPGLPATIDQAFAAAEQDNPGLLQAVMTEKSARERIRQARAGALPTVTANASYGYLGPIDPLIPKQYDRQIQGTVTFTQPLFASGLVISQVRQAQEQDASARVQIESARRAAVQTVSQAWNAMVSAAEQLAADDDAVSAAQVSSEGARKEYQGALRSTLEVLIEEERLRDAQIARAQARYGGLAAQAELLSGMGRLEAAALMQPGIPLYDPIAHFRQVRNAGALPWEPLIAKLDGEVSLGAGAPRPIPAPRPAAATAGLKPAGAPPPMAYADTVPTRPLPGTTAPDTPVRIDDKSSGAP